MKVKLKIGIRTKDGMEVTEKVTNIDALNAENFEEYAFNNFKSMLQDNYDLDYNKDDVWFEVTYQEMHDTDNINNKYTYVVYFSAQKCAYYVNGDLVATYLFSEFKDDSCVFYLNRGEVNNDDEMLTFNCDGDCDNCPFGDNVDMEVVAEAEEEYHEDEHKATLAEIVAQQIFDTEDEAECEDQFVDIIDVIDYIECAIVNCDYDFVYNDEKTECIGISVDIDEISDLVCEYTDEVYDWLKTEGFSVVHIMNNLKKIIFIF